MIRVLIVEDSPVAREFLIHILSSDPDLEVVGTAGSGEEAIGAVARMKPDVITMDIHMPGMNGLDATRRIMETNPTPIVIVSAILDTAEVAITFQAIEAGALAVVPRPAGIGNPGYESTTRELIHTVKLMSEVKVVRRFVRPIRIPSQTLDRTQGEPEIVAPGEVRLVAIGASTGGPVALQTILALLPKPVAVPVVIVQHMAVGFIHGFATWLSQTTAQSVRVAADGETLQASVFYVAPDGFQMKVGRGGTIILGNDRSENGLRPAVSCLFRSTTEIYGEHALGVLLTGMGTDGAKELLLMRTAGSVTIAQDKASSVIFGMPGEAIRIGAATHVLPPEGIARALAKLVV
ncbi:MAG TPA: chemotaxis-specific protein-glutamate methyltransferase CheB [Spirochaetia bacterium]|nr:chemotaxis-specific protein-glutamate methyltransferase CheB [Spirochaetia bacterium]